MPRTRKRPKADPAPPVSDAAQAATEEPASAEVRLLRCGLGHVITDLAKADSAACAACRATSDRIRRDLIGG